MEGMSRSERGISDILSIAVMFIIAILAGVLLHSYGIDAISSANGRQIQMKVEYAYKVLELSNVENSSLTYLEAISENLVMENFGSDASLPGEYIIDRTENVLGYICPQGYGLELELRYGDNRWVQTFPPDAHADTVAFREFSGKVTLIIAGKGENRVAQVNAKLKMFEVSG
ncbi:MAG: hypothetical protein QXG10_00345 [Candidatus Hadarchaeales archaeon]